LGLLGAPSHPGLVSPGAAGCDGPSDRRQRTSQVCSSQNVKTPESAGVFCLLKSDQAMLVEQIVHADTHQIGICACLRTASCCERKPGDGAGEIGGRLEVVKLQVHVFSSKRPVRKKAPLYAASRRPSVIRCRTRERIGCERETSSRRTGCTNAGNRSDHYPKPSHRFRRRERC
jgi:hypothetical protein